MKDPPCRRRKEKIVISEEIPGIRKGKILIKFCPVSVDDLGTIDVTKLVDSGNFFLT